MIASFNRNAWQHGRMPQNSRALDLQTWQFNIYSFAFSLSMPLQFSSIEHMAADTTSGLNDMSWRSIKKFKAHVIMPMAFIFFLTNTKHKPKICLCSNMGGHKTATNRRKISWRINSITGQGGSTMKYIAHFAQCWKGIERSIQI